MRSSAPSRKKRQKSRLQIPGALQRIDSIHGRITSSGALFFPAAAMAARESECAARQPDLRPRNAQGWAFHGPFRPCSMPGGSRCAALVETLRGGYLSCDVMGVPRFAVMKEAIFERRQRFCFAETLFGV